MEFYIFTKPSNSTGNINSYISWIERLFDIKGFQLKQLAIMYVI